MDFFDIVIIGLSAGTLFFQRFSSLTQRILLSTFFITIITHIIFVGVRWQYYLIYALFITKSIITIFEYRSTKKFIRALISIKTILSGDYYFIVFAVGVEGDCGSFHAPPPKPAI